MSDKFSQAITYVLNSEGGYVNNVNDNGGPTNMGITQKTLSSWLGRPATVGDVQSLSRDVACKIYKKNYWDPVLGDQLPVGVGYLVFDIAVHSGVGQAVKILQRAVGVNVDGIMGPETINQVQGKSPTDLLVKITIRRISLMCDLPDFKIFKNGWLKRALTTMLDASQLTSSTFGK